MERFRLKNIIILILVLLNGFLVSSLAQRRTAERDAFHRTAEQLAAGQMISLDLAEGFAQAVREDITPRDSWRAARDFRLHIAVESVKRAFIESVKLAGGAL